MKNYLRFFKEKKFIIPSSLFALLLFANSCVSFRMTDKKVLNTFKEHNQTPKIFHLNYKGTPMRYVASKSIDKKLPTLLFIHGAPGSSADFYRYLRDSDLNKSANLISMDRLGYGYSNYGKAETSITAQAKSAFFILKKNKLQRVIVIGWSYGGPIAAKMAYLYPKTIKHCVLIAPAISPKDEKYFALGKLAYWKATRWMLPKAFRVAEDEKLSHAKELKLMLPDWSKMQTQISYYQGDKDKIVPYANTQFVKNHVAANKLKVVTIKNGSHFIAFKNYDLIKAELLRILDEI